MLINHTDRRWKAGVAAIALLASASSAWAQAAPGSSPPAPVTAPTPAAPPVTPAAPAQEGTAQPEHTQIATTRWTGSLMFNITELHNIYASLQKLPGGEGQDFLDVLTGVPGAIENLPVEAPEDITYPNYFLGSVLITNPQEWSVWVNSKRIESKAPEMTDKDGTLTVLAVERNRVQFSWKPLPKRLKLFKSNWESSQQNVEMQKRSVSNVVFDEAQGGFTFGLRPNQKFISRSMQIIEGQNYYTRSPAPAQAQPAEGSVPPGQPNPALDPAANPTGDPAQIPAQLIAPQAAGPAGTSTDAQNANKLMNMYQAAGELLPVPVVQPPEALVPMNPNQLQ